MRLLLGTEPSPPQALCWHIVEFDVLSSIKQRVQTTLCSFLPDQNAPSFRPISAYSWAPAEAMPPGQKLVGQNGESSWTKRKARESSTDNPRRCSRGLERGQGEKKATEPELLCPHGLVLRFKKVCEAYLKEKTSYVMRSHMLFTGKVPGARTSAHEFRISCSPWPDHLDNNLHLLLRLASPYFLLHKAFGPLLQY